jgi:hypothetical protein
MTPRRRSVSPSYKGRLELALDSCKSGCVKSNRRAAKLYGVPRRTLEGRLKGAQPRALAHLYQRRLTSVEEQLLIRRICEDP